LSVRRFKGCDGTTRQDGCLFSKIPSCAKSEFLTRYYDFGSISDARIAPNNFLIKTHEDFEMLRAALLLAVITAMLPGCGSLLPHGWTGAAGELRRDIVDDVPSLKRMMKPSEERQRSART
jgi:hypothetical protein